MRASDFDPKQREFREMFGKFLEIAIDILKLDSLPEFHFEAFLDHPDQPTFGMYVNGENKLYVGLSGRHPNDIFRTIAHELTHYKQDTEHMLDDRSGETGSPIENQANAMAGIIMRHFNKAYPDYLRSKPVMEDIDTDESLKGLAAAGLIGLGMLGGPKDVASGNLPQDLQRAQQQHRVQMAKKPLAKTQAQKPPAAKPLPAKANPLLKVAKAQGIKGIELAQFLAQMEHESLDFKKMKELGKPTYFNKYDPKHNPKLATKLGNKFKGDGAQFRGRGFIQLTGRENYTQASRDIFGDDRLVKKPDLAAQPDIAARIAAWYWNDRVKPLVKDFSDTTRVTKIINGGLNGLQDRENNFRNYMASLGLMESWSAKYKKSINCSNPKVFSQRAHCQGRKKTEEQELAELNIPQTLKFIKQAHGDQLYGKLPYWTHPRAVAMTGKKIFGNKFNSDAVKVAFLHDVVEDTNTSIDELAKMDFSPQVIEAVGLLTKNKALTYRQNIENIINSGNPLAMMVKYADNYENYSGDKSSWDPARAASSQKKYLMSLNMLGAKLGLKPKQDVMMDNADPQPGMDQKQGIQWEQELMRSWAPKAAAYMSKVVKNSFNSLYPNVPIRVRREDIMIMATTDPKTRFSELDPDVFNQRDNPNWETSFVVTPLFHMEDQTPYLELMVDSAASGQYKGVWKLIAQEWAKYANSQLQKTNAKAAVFSVDEDHSDAWAQIASQAGLKFIVHNR